MLNQPFPSDDDLAGRIQAHDEAAFELLFERYGEALIRHLSGMNHCGPAAEETAQDLVQETFLRVWTHAVQWNRQGSFKAWLYRIATNLALNHLRSLRRHPAQLLPSEDESSWDAWSEEEDTPAPGWLVDSTALGPDAALEQTEERTRLYRAIRGLPEEKREVFRLVHEMDLSIRDAAGRLGIPEGTVKSRLHYAQKKLGEAWRDPSEEKFHDNR
jgi:RNA polymerase sigma-70 factor, ECF subfamily